MAAQSIEVIGVYALPVSEALATAQFDILYDGGQGMSAAEKAEAFASVERQLNSTVLFEVHVRNATPEFDVSDFRKQETYLPRSEWQVAFAERFLTPDGSEAVGDQFTSSVPQDAEFRLAFYIHFWEPGAVLLGPTGSLATPELANMPERLRKLVPYEPVD